MEPVGADLMIDPFDEEVPVHGEVRGIGRNYGHPLRYVPVEHLIDGVGVPVGEVTQTEDGGRVLVDREVIVGPVEGFAGVRDELGPARPGPMPEGRLGGRVLLFDGGRVVGRYGGASGLEFRYVSGCLLYTSPSPRD